MFQAPAPALVLASQSASRAALLTAAGLTFEQMPAHIDEAMVKQSAMAEGRTAADCALLLAELKAARVARARPEALVIGADQLLVCDGRWLDKPQDRGAAERSLRFLSGRCHELVTAIVCSRGGAVVWRHVARPELEMRTVSEGFLQAYLDAEGEAVTTTVGAYRLEGLGIHLFHRIAGEHAAILGMPMLALLAFLRQHRVLSG